MNLVNHPNRSETGRKMHMAVIGGGRRCLSLLQTLESDILKGLNAEIVGVADIDPHAVGYAYSKLLGIYTTSDFRTLFDIANLEIVINLTGRSHVTRQLTDLAPPSITVFSHPASRLFQEIVEEVLGAAKQFDRQADEISRAHAFAQAMAQATIVGVIVLDLNSRVVWINEAALRIAGLSKEEALGQYCFQVSHQQVNPCKGPETPCPMKETMDTGQAAHAIHEHHSADGQTTYCDISTFPLFDRAGEVVEVVEIMRDMTADLNQKLEQRTQALKEDLARMVQEDKLIALGKMVASVAHEINNPIGSIINFTMLILETLREGSPNRNQVTDFIRQLELTLREAERCGKIVGNLLSFARQQPMETKVIDLCEMMERISQLVDHTTRLSNIELSWEYEHPPLRVTGDYNQIQQCLLNLIFNAMEAMPEGGHLKITAGRDINSDCIWISVADQGTGIASRHLPHIYEPFFTTKREGCGVGLGLSMVYGIIREHRGEISVKSREGDGTTFRISLPAAPDSVPGE